MMTVFVFTFVCLFPVMLTRDFTPSNELRYLSIADEALADGHIFAFYNHGLAYADKPPLYFWIVMLCRLLFGHHSCLALFTKGPVGLLMPPLSIAVFLAVKRDWKGFGKYLGLKTWGIIAGLAALWIGCVWIEGGSEYINNLLVKQTVGRAVNAFTHAKPFWFYLVAIIWCLAPYSLLLIGSFIASLLPDRKTGAEKALGTAQPKSGVPDTSKAAGQSKQRRSNLEVLFLCTTISTVAMLSSFSSKLPIYLVPVLPFCVYLFPVVLDRIGERGWMRWGVGIFSIIFTVIGLAALPVLFGAVKIPALNDLLTEYPFALEAPIINGIILLTLANILGIWFLLKREVWNIPALLLGAGLFLAAFSASAVVKDINPYIGYGSICSKVPEGTDVATVFLHRPENIDAYIGRQITDYGKEPERLVEAVSASDKPLTIITRTSRLETIPELQKLFSNGTVLYSGPYCLTTISKK